MFYVSIYRLPNCSDLAMPERATLGSAGVDIRAAIPINESWILAPGSRILIPTGFIIAIPSGYEAQIRSRSGLAFHSGIIVLNSPGTIDADYRGEIKVLLINLGDENFYLKRGDRIAQLVITKVANWFWQEESCLTALGDTQRDSNGYGSTGVV